MNFNTFNMVLTGFIILMCLVMAYFLMFTDLMIDGLRGNRRIILEVVLIMYAVFRSYRLYKAMSNQKMEE